MKVLTCSDNALGNAISDLLPLLSIWKRRNATIHGILRNKHAYRLFRETPYFDRILPLYDKDDLWHDLIKDVPQWFEDYDKVYVVNNRQMPGVEKSEKVPVDYRPAMRVAEYGELFSPEDILLDINWYQKYYKDFKCHSKTVLLNTQSTSFHRCYTRPLKEELAKLGFDVREFNYRRDIRENLHLVHQAAHILTVDTSTMWLARTLGKVPYVFMARESGTLPAFGPNTEKRHGLKNLIPWKENLNDTAPDFIASQFSGAIQTIPVI